MASNYVWSFRTVPGNGPPTVIFTLPLNGATAVPTNQVLSDTFSEAMNAATIDHATTFTLTGPGATSVTGTVAYSAAGSCWPTFTSICEPCSEHTLYGHDHYRSYEAPRWYSSGCQLRLDFHRQPRRFSERRADGVHLDEPRRNAAANVPLNQIVTATFSMAMNPATINSTTFMLTGPGTTPVPGLVAYAGIAKHADVYAVSPICFPSTLYTATITTGAQNLAGTALANDYVWTFTTGTSANTTAPEIVSTVPVNSATNRPLNQAVSATFSEAMNPLTITTDTFQLTGPGGTAIAGTVSYDPVSFIATFTPAALLITDSTYTATLTSGVTDSTGNPLGTTGAPNPWMFTTGAAAVPPPIILGPTIALFGGFGGNAGMTNQGIHTVINGNIGTTGASTTMTGFYDESVAAVAGVYPCSYTVTPSNMGLVNGTIDTAPPPPSGACPNEGTANTMAIATEAALEAQTAYTTLQGLPSDGVLAAEVGGTTIYPRRLHKRKFSRHNPWASYPGRQGRPQCVLGLPDWIISHRRHADST